MTLTLRRHVSSHATTNGIFPKQMTHNVLLLQRCHVRRVLVVFLVIFVVYRRQVAISQAITKLMAVPLQATTVSVETSSGGSSGDAATKLSTPLDDTWPPRDILDRLATTTTTTTVNDNERRLVVTFVNCGYAQFADNWATHLEKLGVTNYAIVPLDDGAYTLLTKSSTPTTPARFAQHVLPVPPLNLTHQQPAPKQVSLFGKSGFREITMSRPVLLEAFLLANYTILYNDVDMVWCRNVWDYIDQHLAVESSSAGKSAMAYAQDGSPAKLCTCLFYLQPVDENIQLLQAWHGTPVPAGKHDQTAFNQMWRRRRSSPQQQSIGSNVHLHEEHVFDPHLFPSGLHRVANVTDTTGSLQDRPEFMLHANYMLYPAKRPSLQKLGAWDPSGDITDQMIQETCG